MAPSNPSDDTRTRTQRRRFLFGGLGVLATGIGAAWWERRELAAGLVHVINGNNPDVRLTGAPSTQGAPCVLTSAQAEGPFHFPPPERQDVTEDRPGRALELTLRLVRAPACTPILDAAVEIWSCDAEGAYSGYPPAISHDAWEALVFFARHMERGETGELHVEPPSSTTFLRGLQRTDREGRVAFRTIFPGFYLGRVPHVHVRATTREGERLTTQLYFEPALHERLYRSTSPYDRFGACPTTFANDGFLAKTTTPVEGVLLDVPWQERGPLRANAYLGIRES